MTCNWCKAKPGDRYRLTEFGRWAYCILCGADTASLFPVNVTYDGKVGDKHYFTFERLLSCPGCGKTAGGCSQDCPDEGEMVELPSYLELPINEPIKEKE